MAGQAPDHLHLAARNRARCSATFHCKEQWICNASSSMGTSFAIGVPDLALSFNEAAAML
jgi:hypothetical protein